MLYRVNEITGVGVLSPPVDLIADGASAYLVLWLGSADPDAVVENGHEVQSMEEWNAFVEKLAQHPSLVGIEIYDGEQLGNFIDSLGFIAGKFEKAHVYHQLQILEKKVKTEKEEKDAQGDDGAAGAGVAGAPEDEGADSVAEAVPEGTGRSGTAPAEAGPAAGPGADSAAG